MYCSLGFGRTQKSGVGWSRGGGKVMAEMMAGEVFFVGNQGAGEEEEEGNLDRWVQRQCEGLRQEEPL